MKRVAACHLGWVVVVLAVPAMTCDRVFQISGEMRPNFQVEVQDRNGKPLAGVKVELEQEMKKEPYYRPIHSARTDFSGRVSFSRVPSGRYLLSYSYLQVGDAPTLLVRKSPRATSIVRVQWPGRDILKAQNVAGTFEARFFRDTGKGTVIDMAYKQEGPFSNEEISLTRVDSGQIVGTTTTDGQGHFAFGTKEPGLYILHVKELPTAKTRHDMDIEGDIFVEVSASADGQQLPTLQLNESSCGLSYKRVDPETTVLR